MPLQQPKLDDLDSATVEASLRSEIPIYAPEWTDHNDSDPGIAMIQLFSLLTEQIGYRLNQIPEKNYIEFLKMVGVKLQPAIPATTRMNFIISKPDKCDIFSLPKGSRINASTPAEPAPVFETDKQIDILPVQLAALVTTQAADLRNINDVGETGPGALDPQTYIDTRYSLAWDGKSPKLKDMPVEPVSLFYESTENTHQHLWLGLAFNQQLNAGFLGARVTLTLQLDDDEQPDEEAVAQCGQADTQLLDEDNVAYRYYRKARVGETEGKWESLPVIGDSTDSWQKSGEIRFDVPMDMGPVADDEWLAVEDIGTDTIAHPLEGSLKTPVDNTGDKVAISGWLHVEFINVRPKLRIRTLSFNVVPATAAQTIKNEELQRGDNSPGQQRTLANQSVLAGSLNLISLGPPPVRELRQWTQVDSFDGVSAQERVYVLDPESGQLVFGNAIHGRPPEEGERLIAQEYRYGGGKNTESDVGLVNIPNSLPPKIEAAVNIVSALGGRDTETTEEAKLRAPGEFQSQARAVTNNDFTFHAEQTPGVRVARAEVVSLHRPRPESGIKGPGLELDKVAPGVVSVLTVPDEPGLYPTPTKGMLKRVCQHLDRVRLITSEVYAAAPQYVRLFEIQVRIMAEPGYSRTALTEAISEQLKNYFHVLTGGENGEGFGFGAVIHHADLVAQVFRTPGVKRVEQLSAWYDGNTPENTDPEFIWRRQYIFKELLNVPQGDESWKSYARLLTSCPAQSHEDELIQLEEDEVPFVDTQSLTVQVL